MLKVRTFGAVVIMLFIFVGNVHASLIDLFYSYTRSDQYLQSFLDIYKKSMPQKEKKEAGKQIDVYKEAYFLLLDNYIHEIHDKEKEELSQKATKALNTYLDKTKKAKQVIKAKDSMEFIMESVFNNIDAHTLWLTPKLSSEFIANLSGNHKGIGILFNYDKTKHMIFVIRVFDNSPAQAAGLKKGDYIYAVDGKPINPKQKLEDVVNSIRGENGTKVKLTIKRQDKTLLFLVTRGDYKVPSVEYKILEKKYGYIVINNFNQDTANIFKEGLNVMQVNKLQGLVIDVRNNPGGLLTAVVLIADSLLSGDVIVSIKGRNTEENQSFVSLNKTDVSQRIPIVVLTNSMSASASELLAGALALNNRAAIMGDSTFGKWSVQSSFTLKNNSIFNITTQLFYGPKDATFQGTGIAPDVEIIDEFHSKAFRENNYKNYLQTKDLYNKRKPFLTIKDKSCPSYGESKDKILGCAVIYLKSNAIKEKFRAKLVQ